MQMAFEVKGLDNALAAIRAAFPRDPEQQRRILNQSMSAAAKKVIVPMAKQLALVGDGSGALSEAIGVRAVSKRRALAKGMAASVEVTPVRSNRKAMALYIAHYYTARGRTAPAKMVTSGIRHGHLVEFGTKKGMRARSFLGVSGEAQRGAYVSAFSASVSKKIEAAVRRRARKASRR